MMVILSTIMSKKEKTKETFDPKQKVIILSIRYQKRNLMRRLQDPLLSRKFENPV